MSVPMKRPHTETVIIGQERFQVPRQTAKAVLVLLKSAAEKPTDTMLAEESEIIRKLDNKYSQAGACLQGARVKEGLSQVELAKTLGISQTNLSKMELGKRAIGKKMAQRIAKILNVDYRIFL